MVNAKGLHEKRQHQRFKIEFPIQINIGAQLSLEGKLRDISTKGAFIVMNTGLYLNTNDEIGFTIYTDSSDEKVIKGMACISRIYPGKGFAVYFTKMNCDLKQYLNRLVDLK
ncbi:MAG: PilZ domain-containing protein [Candidatus Zapsychrus exili]|nr:PilZ domain-containing protein [Candidatus Zapsychrus exili]